MDDSQAAFVTMLMDRLQALEGKCSCLEQRMIN